MEAWSFLAALIALVLLGVLAGALTGLTPGLHVNNVAAVLVAAQGSGASLLASLAGPVADDGAVAVLLSAFLLSTATSHAVFDFVPSVFFGAPSEETALSILPGHRLLLEGRGAHAVALAARGALLGALASLVAVIPLRLVLADPVDLADRFAPYTPAFIASILAALLLSEARGRADRWRRVAWAAGTQALAGLLGLAVLRGPSGVAPDVALFPLFTGLFGFPTLLIAARAAPSAIPPQVLERIRRATRLDATQVLRGTAAGAAVSWLPGLSGGAAASLASVGGRRSNAEAYMVLLGAVSTSTAILSVTVLFVIGRARSGVAAAVRTLHGSETGWATPTSLPGAVVVLLAAAVLGAAVAAPLATRLARGIARRWSRVNATRLAQATLAGLVVLLAVIAGPGGVVVAAVTALAGLVPVRSGVQRVHLMAALLVPILASNLAH
ncbi:MAG: tripartite tricarboxylate transporter permease [Methanobacteriota archaeon]